MKITYEQLYRSYPVFNQLMNEALPINTTRKFKMFIESVNPHLEQIESVQNELLKKYSDETEKDVFEIVPENRPKFVKELQKYLQFEIEVAWDKIGIDELGEKVNISIKDLETISYLLKNYQNVAVM
tara:strand:+ start:1154 stop:1534 length:381 start_codon:yes stop_codon:yes gene_type:complete